MKKTIPTMVAATLAVCALAETPAVWKQYASDWKAGRASVLPDYSHAGYKYGAESISDVKWKEWDRLKVLHREDKETQ
jgi:hypothetical protein